MCWRAATGAKRSFVTTTTGALSSTGEVRRSHDAQRAQSLLRDGLRAAGMTVTQARIAERQRMRSAANVSQQLRRGTSAKTLPQSLRRSLRDQTLSNVEP
jgi:LmbE family N-acetylglucosaminyl deacetylase